MHRSPNQPEPVFRKLWPVERDKLRDHLLRLGPSSRAMRFGHSVSDRFIEDYCRGFDGLGTIVYGALIADVLRAAAELHLDARPWPRAAEAAFSVEDRWQDSGLGTALMSRAIVAARNRGVAKLHMICLSDNLRMRRIAMKHRARLTLTGGEIDGWLDPATPDRLSLMREWLDDASGVMTYLMNLWPPAGGASVPAKNRLERDLL